MAHLPTEITRDHFAEVLNARMEARIDQMLNSVMEADGFVRPVQKRMQAALQDALVLKVEKHVDDEMAGPKFKDNFKRSMNRVLDDALALKMNYVLDEEMKTPRFAKSVVESLDAEVDNHLEEKVVDYMDAAMAQPDWHNSLMDTLDGQVDENVDDEIQGLDIQGKLEETLGEIMEEKVEENVNAFLECGMRQPDFLEWVRWRLNGKLEEKMDGLLGERLNVELAARMTR